MSKKIKVFGVSSELDESSKSSNDSESRPGPWTVLREKTKKGVIRQRRFAAARRADERFCHIDGVSVSLEEVKKKRGGGGSDADDDLTAKFPGKIRKLLVKKGQKVKEAESLLLMEAMKMEFAVKAPFDGTISAIKVKEAQQINPGDRLIDMVPVEGGGSP